MPFAAYGAGSPLPYSIVAGDLNGDQKPDLVLTNWLADSISVLINQGAGTFNAAPVAYPADAQPVSAALGDLDGNGSLDVAVASVTGQRFAVRLNNGAGLLGAPVSYPSHWGHYGFAEIRIVDVNKDAKQDIVASTYSSTESFTNDGAGHMTFIQALGGYQDPCPGLGMSIGDFSGDGTLSTACPIYPLRFPGNTVVFLEPITQVQGIIPKTVTMGIGPDSIAAGDLDGDGLLDLATANSTSNDLTVRHNMGKAVFGAEVSYGVGPSPRSIQIADVTGDGKPDLIVVISSTNLVTILPNVGGGMFGAARTFAAGSNPIAVVVADFNGDGKLDLAVANAATGSYVSVLINQSTCK